MTEPTGNYKLISEETEEIATIVKRKEATDTTGIVKTTGIVTNMRNEDVAPDLNLNLNPPQKAAIVVTVRRRSREENVQEVE
jgi:hypothetical protein